MNRLAAERVSRLRGHINNGLSQSDSESKISLSRVLDTEGKVVAGMPEFARDPAILLRLYRFLVLTRIFDTKAVALQRTGRLGTYASSLGQEAVAVGAARKPVARSGCPALSAEFHSMRSEQPDLEWRPALMLPASLSTSICKARVYPSRALGQSGNMRRAFWPSEEPSLLLQATQVARWQMRLALMSGG